MAKTNSDTKSLSLAILLATTFLPGSEKFNIIRIVIVFILCVANNGNYSTSLVAFKGKQVISLWLSSILLASFFVLVFDGAVNQGVVIHEIARLVYYALIMHLCSKLRVDLRFLFYCCVVILCIHFSIQITQYFRLGIFDSYIEKYYLAGNVENIHYQLAIKDYYAFRSGSIFINPNVYVCYPYLSLAVFLEYHRRTGSVVSLIMVGVAFLSIVLTGSRMGLGAFLIILSWYFFFGPRSETRRNNGATTPVLILIVASLVAANWGKVASFADGMRAFSFDEAYEGSGSMKLAGFVYYLSNTNPIYWLTGSLGSYSLNVQIDMELGYVFAWFGILGIIWYVKLLRVIYYNHNSEFRVISSIATLSILLTAIGASSVLNMSVFPYICSVALTNIVFNPDK